MRRTCSAAVCCAAGRCRTSSHAPTACRSSSHTPSRMPWLPLPLRQASSDACRKPCSVHPDELCTIGTDKQQEHASSDACGSAILVPSW